MSSAVGKSIITGSRDDIYVGNRFYDHLSQHFFIRGVLENLQADDTIYRFH